MVGFGRRALQGGREQFLLCDVQATLTEDVWSLFHRDMIQCEVELNGVVLWVVSLQGGVRLISRPRSSEPGVRGVP